MAQKKITTTPDSGAAKPPEKADKKPSSRPRKKPLKATAAPVRADTIETHLPIVAIGASAGGLEAFQQFFTNMPPDSGMAFVLIQHLDPTHKSILSELVRRYTTMKVVEVIDGAPVEPDTVFVIPPNRYMAILHGKLHLLDATLIPGLRAPIDYFFRSLAADQKEKAICLVLSGTGAEGSMGLRAVKGEGGMVMVQEPESAKYDGMPRSALATGLADYVLPPGKMPEQLIAYVRHALVKAPGVDEKPASSDADQMEKVFILVRDHTGHDFSYYKRNTILRRIDRRMAVHQIRRLPDYVRYLQEEPREAELLFKELLIGVTNFFRDKEAFRILRDKAISKLIETRAREGGVRVWVPGCATGEEAYTIAMVIRSVMNELKQDFPVQIFATDIDHDAIETARVGLFPGSIAVDVARGLLDRFFNKEDASYRIKKEIRDMVVFALQNVITDPPFSKIDLISCRNLMIYLGSQLQKKVLPLFHYALRKGGFLFLGSSETIGEFTDYFSVVDRKWKIFRRQEVEFTERPIVELRSPTVTDRRVEALAPLRPAHVGKTTHREAAEKIILDDYSPPGVIINEKSEIVFIHGKTGKFLEPAPGEANLNLLAMARDELKLELATAIRKASAQKSPIRVERLAVKTIEGDQLINLVVKPISEPPQLKGTLIVLFEQVSQEHGTDSTAQPADGPTAPIPRIRQLEQELSSTKEYLQTTIEELETTNEELKSTNEELQSSNEELQSTNEELETSKEELQSVNEELTTVNSEHQQKIDELSKASSDFNNLLASTEIGTIFLDADLKIRRFTPAATDFFNLMQTDVGRPVSHLASNMRYDHLIDDARKVLKTLIPIEVEIETKVNRWYLMRILPYRTVENMIDGVVVTFVVISQRRMTIEEAAQSKERLVADLDAMTRLHKVASLFVGPSSLNQVLEEILESAIAITRADMGNIQLADRRSGSLKIVVHRGFDRPWLDYWNEVHEGQGACGTALEAGKRIIVEDVTRSSILVDTRTLQVQLAAGVRAVQSTPLIGRAGAVIGILSTHFKTPQRPDDGALRALDLLARQTTDIIERSWAEDDLRLMSAVVKNSDDAIAVVDLNGRVMKWNRGAVLMYGWSEAEAVGMNFADFAPADKRDELHALICRVKTEEAPPRFETQRVTKDGRVIDVWATATKLVDQAGEIIAVATREQDLKHLIEARKGR
jgi:two-component system CheB/CheR fusion protein